MKTSKLLILTALASSLVLSACDTGPAKKYTYRTWSTALGSKWDPFTWETSADSSMLGYVSDAFVGFAPLDTEKASWQWTYDLATKVTDVSNDHKDEFAKYHINADTSADLTGKGYVYDIELRKGNKWETKTVGDKTYGGTEIKADDYVESFKLLLDPARKNYRANLYYSGESAVAGGNQYYNNDQERVYASVAYADPAAVAAAQAAGTPVYIDVWDFWGAEGYTDAEGKECPQWLDITDETVYGEAQEDAFSAALVWATYGTPYFSYFKFAKASDNWGYGKKYEETVGMYKVNDYTIRYFLETPEDINYFLTHLTSTWLVNLDLFNDLSYDDETTGLKLSKYGTDFNTTISYGPYKMASYQEGKQVTYTQNENWYGWEKQFNGALLSYTQFEVNGKKQQQYQTTDIVIDVLTQESAKLAFERGELNDYTPTAAELPEYSLSKALYQVDETYTMSFFFDTNLEDLQAMDTAGTNTNGVVMSNYNFRKAFSLAIDRADWVTTTEAYKPAYSMLNSLYYYDIYNNPESQYRKTEQAMKAIVEFYGVEYGPGKTYATLEDAYKSITGYNLTQAQQLFKTACEELVAAGLYTAGQDVKIKVAYKKGALESSDQAQVAAMNKYLEAARQGSGFGKIELEAVGNLKDRYGDVGTRGIYAIGYGAWGGAAFYPFRNFQVYMDPDQYSIHEGRCWDPTTETLTLKVNGSDVTMTYQQWSESMVGNGPYANADFNTKLDILSALEKDFLGKYYRIPLAGSCISSLLGYQQHYFTKEYNIMYDFGGMRLMGYDYDDEAWAAYVAEQGGTLNYK